MLITRQRVAHVLSDTCSRVHLICIVFGFAPPLSSPIAPDNVAPQIATLGKIIETVKNSLSKLLDMTPSGHAAHSVMQHRVTALRIVYFALTPTNIFLNAWKILNDTRTLQFVHRSYRIWTSVVKNMSS